MQLTFMRQCVEEVFNWRQTICTGLYCVEEVFNWRQTICTGLYTFMMLPLGF